MSERKKRVPVEGPVIEYMRSHPNKPQSSTQVARALGLRTNSVATSMGRWADRGQLRSLREQMGQGWYVYDGPAEADMPAHPNAQKGAMFMVVGRTASGQVFVEDEDGVLWPLGDR